MYNLRSRDQGTPLAEGLFQSPVTSGIIAEGLQDSGLHGSVPLLSCRYHGGLDALGKAHCSQESIALTTL